MASELAGSYSDDTDTWTGLSQLAAQAAHILNVSDKITSTGSHDEWATLRESLQDGLGGLRAAIDYVIGQNGLNWDAVNKQRDRKRALYERRDEEPRAARDQEATAEPAAAIAEDRRASRASATTRNRSRACPAATPASSSLAR